jgi:hypothetical protein
VPQSSALDPGSRAGALEAMAATADDGTPLDVLVVGGGIVGSVEAM